MLVALAPKIYSAIEMTFYSVSLFVFCWQEFGNEKRKVGGLKTKVKEIEKEIRQHFWWCMIENETLHVEIRVLH